MTKRLLIVTTVPSTLWAFLLPFARHFREKGWLVDGAACGISQMDECVEAFDRVWDINWSRNPMDFRHFGETPNYLRALISREAYDLVHVHTPVAGFVTRYALKSLPRDIKPKVVYTAHGFHFYNGGSFIRNRVFLSLEKTAGKWTDYLVVINREDETAARNHRILPEDHIVYMPGIGVDTKVYSRENIPTGQIEVVWKELGVPPNDHLLLMVAEFIPRKRHVDAIRAFAGLDGTDCHLILAGTGPLMEQTKTLAYELGVLDRVKFLGFRRDVPALMLASDALLLPSVHEGLARSIMEAMSLGIPVIGSDVRGVRDLLQDGSGILAALGDVDGLTGAMRQLIRFPETAKQLSQSALEKIKNYDTSIIVEMHDHLYSRILNEG